MFFAGSCKGSDLTMEIVYVCFSVCSFKSFLSACVQKEMKGLSKIVLLSLSHANFYFCAGLHNDILLAPEMGGRAPGLYLVLRSGSSGA